MIDLTSIAQLATIVGVVVTLAVGIPQVMKNVHIWWHKRQYKKKGLKKS